VNPTSEVVLRCVDDVLEAAIDNRFEGVEPGLRSLAQRVAVSSLPSIIRASCTSAAGTTA
jgi:hypothetical protein